MDNNYIEEVIKQAKTLPSGIHHVHIMHDDLCNVFNGGECNCNPEISMKKGE